MNILEWAETLYTEENKDTNIPRSKADKQSKLTNYKEEEHQSSHAEEEELQKQIKLDHEGGKYPCKKCEHKATTTYRLKRHPQEEHIFLIFPIFSAFFV